MGHDFSDIFAKYEDIFAKVDTAFAAVKNQCPDEVTCHKGCTSCCHALFDVSLVEAMYLKEAFDRLPVEERETIKERADEAERTQHKIMRKAMKAREKGTETNELLEDLSRVRIRCPLLDDEGACTLYEARPVTCRLYGAPMAFDGQTRTCGDTGFEPGGAYPTIHVEKIHDQLVGLAQELQDSLHTRYSGLSTLFVPVAVAVNTTCDDEYLGILDSDKIAEIKDEMVQQEQAIRQAEEHFRQRGMATEESQGLHDISAACTTDCTTCKVDGCGDRSADSSGGCTGSPTIVEFGGKD